VVQRKCACSALSALPHKGHSSKIAKRVEHSGVVSAKVWSDDSTLSGTFQFFTVAAKDAVMRPYLILLRFDLK
jgi:hypothetical protein